MNWNLKISKHQHFRDRAHLLLRIIFLLPFLIYSPPLFTLPLSTLGPACEENTRAPLPSDFFQWQSPSRSSKGRTEYGQANYSPGSLLVGLPWAACAPRPKVMVHHYKTFSFWVLVINPSSHLFPLEVATVPLLPISN